MSMSCFKTLRMLLVAGAAPWLVSSAVEANELNVVAADRPASFDFSPLNLDDQQLAQAERVTGDVLAEASPSEAQPQETGSLAKAAQNPIASMSSLPIQWNSTPSTAFPGGKHNQTVNVVNVQPVVPFPVSKDLTLVTRTIVPFISQPAAGGTTVQGLGDINPSVFFVPTLKGNFTVGVGPTLIIPSATDTRLGSQRWSAGPTGVVVYTKGRIVAGGLINNVWSFAGERGNDVNQMTIQPFLNYNLPKGWYLTSSPIITANWNHAENKGWTVPVGAGVGRVFVIGKQPINASLSAYYNVVKPELGGKTFLGDWTIRTQVQFLFPKRG